MEINHHMQWSQERKLRLMDRYNRDHRNVDLYVGKFLNKFIFGEPIQKNSPLILPNSYKIKNEDLKEGEIIPVGVRKRKFSEFQQDYDEVEDQLALSGFKSLLNYLKEKHEKN